MTRGRADSHRDDHAIELDSEDPPPIYSHPQQTSTEKSHLAGENETHECEVIETFPIHTNCSCPER